MKSALPSKPVIIPGVQVLVLSAMALLIASYVLLRYGGEWIVGGDTNLFTAQIRPILDTGVLVTKKGAAYPNGYGYQALAAFLINVTGLKLAQVQLFGATLLIVWIVVPAWLVYREWTGTAHGASLATTIFLLQPELLFGIMRGTHEKFTRGLMFLCLYILTRSLRSRHRPALLASFVLTYYLIAYAQISFNNLFASSFMYAVLLAFILSRILFLRVDRFQSSIWLLRRLVYVVVISLILTFIFTFYFYEPAERNLQVLQTIGDQLASLFVVNAEETSAVNPYSRWVVRAWVSLPTYFLVSLANWLLLLSSAAIWSWWTFCWWFRRREPRGEGETLLWAFFGAFGFLGAASIVADVSGALSSNMQHRLFPSIVMVAAPVVAKWLAEWRPSLPVIGKLVMHTVWVGMALLAVLSLAKATNEPLVSNKWLFYRPGEVKALSWAEQALSNRFVWVGIDRRLVDIIVMRPELTRGAIHPDRAAVEPSTKDFLVSDVIRSQSQRTGLSLPIKADDLVTYDNGQAQIYHRRPQTPYQR